MRAGSAARAMTTLCGSNPRSKVTRATKLRKSNPAAVKSTRASATCPVASTACPRFARRRPKPPAAGGLASLSVRTRSARAQARVGAAPKRRPAPIDKAVAKASTFPSTPIDLVESGHASRNHCGGGAHDPGSHGDDDSAVDRLRVRLDDEGRPEFGPLGWELEAIGEDPDDDVGLVLELDRCADDVRVRSEPVRPGAVAQQHDPERAVDGIGVREDPAELRCCARSSGKSEGLTAAAERLAGPSAPVEHDGDLRVGGELLERPRVIPQQQQIGARQHRNPLPSWRGLSQADDPLGIGIRQRPAGADRVRV